MIQVFHIKSRTWIWRKDRTYCLQCGHRVSPDRENGIPVCARCARCAMLRALGERIEG